MSGQGNHRAYLLSMMNTESLPCEIVKFVHIDEVDNWSNVTNGIYTVEYALEIFNFVFSGRNVCRGIV